MSNITPANHGEIRAQNAPADFSEAATRTPIGVSPRKKRHQSGALHIPKGCQFSVSGPHGNRPCGSCLYCREMKLHRAGNTAALEAVLHKKTVWATFTFDPSQAEKIEAKRNDRFQTARQKQTTWQSYALTQWKETLVEQRKRLRVPALLPFSWRAWLEFGQSGDHNHFHLLVHGDDISTRQIRNAWTFGFDKVRLSRSRDPRQHARYAAKAAKYHSKDQKPSGFKGRSNFRSVRYGKPCRLLERAKAHPDTWLTIVRDEHGFRPRAPGYPIVGPKTDRVFKEWALDAISEQLREGVPVFLQERDLC